MKKERMKINGIPSTIWGEKSNKVLIAVHGSMSNKEDTVIEILANKVVEIGYQVISFDLPEHGDRKNEKTLCKVQNCVENLEDIMKYVKEQKYEEINLFACSMGAYFSLLAYKNENINTCLFISPIANMKALIDNMMIWSNTTEEMLKEKQEIKTDFGQILYWDYYCYVKENPIKFWNKNTYILYGSKDNMQEEKIIRDFAEKYNCNLDILENGEHFFHTEEQLKYYKQWLNKVFDI